MAAAEEKKPGFFSRLFKKEDPNAAGAAPAASAAKKGGPDSVKLQFPVTCATWSLDCKWVALGDIAGNIVLYTADILSRKIHMVPKQVVPSQFKASGGLAANPVTCIAFSPNCLHVLSVSEGAPIQILNVMTGQQQFIEKKDRISSAAWSCDGEFLALGTREGTIDVHCVRNNYALQETIPAHIDGVHSLEFCPIGPKKFLLASGGMNPDDAVKVWDTHSFSTHGASQCVFAAKLSQFWKRDKAYVTVKWTCDSRFLLCGDFAGMVSVFDVHNRRYLGTLEGHCLRIRSISCSPDLRYAATSSEDQMIKIWEVATRKCVFTHLSQSNSVSVIWVPSMHCDASILVSEGEYLGILYPAFDAFGFDNQPRQHEDLDINNALDHGSSKPKPRPNLHSNAQNGMYLDSNFAQPLLQGDPQNFEHGGRTSPSPQRAPQYSPPHAQSQPQQQQRSSVVANDRKEYYDSKTSPRADYAPEPAQSPALQQQDSGSRRFSLSDSPIAQFPQFEHLVHLFKAKTRELQQYEETVKKGREAFLQMHGGQFPQPVAPAAPPAQPQQPNFLDPYDTSRPMAPPLNRDDSQLEGEGVSALSPSPARVDDDDRPFFQLLNIQQQAPPQAVSSPVRPAPADFIATPMQPAAAPVAHDDPGKSDVHKAMLMEIRSLEAKLTPMAKVLESQIRVATASARWKQRFWKESRVADAEKAAYYQEMLEELERNAQVVESYYAACQSVPHVFPQDSPVLAPRPNGIFDSVPQQQVDIINQMWHQSIEEHCARFLTAAKVNDQVVLDACITMGIEVNVREKSNGATALMFAAAMGYSGIVRSLLMAGAKINLQNSQGDSALILAAESAHSDIVEILLDHGADMNLRNNKRMSALDASCSPSYANRGAGAPPPNPQSLEKIRHLLAKTAPAPMPSAAPQPQPAAPQVDRNSPYVKYREQIESLKGMGFSNEDDCVAALVSYNGDFRKALNQLLSEPSRPASKPAAVSPRKPAASQPQHHHQQPQSPYPNNVYGAYQQPPPQHHQQPREDEAAKYSTQLTMLFDMGFTDMDANRVAIVAAKGDMGVAVQNLVSQPQRSQPAKPAYSQPPQPQPQKPAQQQYGGYPGFSNNQQPQYQQPHQPPPQQPAGYPGFAPSQPVNNNANRGGYPGFGPAQQQPPQQPPQPPQQQSYPYQPYQQPPPAQPQVPYQSPYGQAPPQPQAQPQQPIPGLQGFFSQPAAAQPRVSQPAAAQPRVSQPAAAQPNVQALYASAPSPYAPQQASPGQLLPYQQPIPPVSVTVQPASPAFQRPPPFAPDSQSAPISAAAPTLPAAAAVSVSVPPSSVGSPSPSQESGDSSIPRSASRNNMDLLKQLSESPFTVTLTDHSTITDPQYYQNQWASLPMSHSVEWELKHKCQDDAVAASCKTDAIEQMLAKKYFFTMASGNVEGQLKFYLSAQAIKTPKEKPARSADEEAMSAFLAAAGAPAAEEKGPAAPETELVLIELLILLKTGRAQLQLRCATAAGRDLMVPRLREALGGLLKQI